MNSQFQPDDVAFMRHALALAATTIGQTWPNPAVGCVLVKNGQIVGSGFSARGGRPHAEPQALAEAGDKAKGATAYVTLEPCSHHGKTPPCADALIAAGIKRVVVGCLDPDERVNGNGIAKLVEAGIDVTLGVCEAECVQFNAGFFSRVKTGRPFVSLKLATSLDGKVANAKGESQWITGEEARNYGHMLRATHDALLTGIGTVLTDNPRLTCRLPNMQERSPLRIVLDSTLRMPADAAAIEPEKLWVITTERASQEARNKLQNAGALVHTIGKTVIDPDALLTWLGEQGLTRVLVEAGPKVSTSFFPLAKRIYWFRAPMLIGTDGLSAIDIKSAPLADLTRYNRESLVALGKDQLEIYSRPESEDA